MRFRARNVLFKIRFWGYYLPPLKFLPQVFHVNYSLREKTARCAAR